MSRAGKTKRLALAVLLGLGLTFLGCGGGGSSGGGTVAADDSDSDTAAKPVSGPAVDLLFLMDVSGSVDVEVLKENREAIFADLDALDANLAIGVASFCDFPMEPWGSEGDEPFSLLQAITTDRAKAAAGIEALATPSQGGDTEESQLEALFLSAGQDLDGDGIEAEPAGWRAGAKRVIVLITDAAFHEPDDGSGGEVLYPGPTMDETIQALQAGEVMVLGLPVGRPLPQLTEIVTATEGTEVQIAPDGTGLVDFLRATLPNLVAALASPAEPAP